MATLAEKHSSLAEQISALDLERKRISAKLISELQRRGSTAVEHRGFRIALVQTRTVMYMLDKLQKEIPPTLVKKITRPVLDPEKLAQAVQDGKISPHTLESCSEIKYAAPYIKVSARGGE